MEQRVSDAEGDQATGSARQKAQEVAETARERSEDVAVATREQSRGVTDSAREQAGRVADEAVNQGRDVVDDTRQRVHQEARQQTRRAAGALHSTGEQVRALAEGRPQEAGQFSQLAQRAAERLAGVGDRVEERGFDGIVAETEDYARRRPGAFLLSSATAGFVLGRLLRNRGSEDGR